MDDDLSDFERSVFTHGGKSAACSGRGTGPAVIVMSEMPGITPKVAEFARRVADIGCTAVLPHLFGVAGQGPARRRSAADCSRYGLSTFVPLCVSREFTTWAAGPHVAGHRLAAGARRRRARALRRPGVGAVGMCFTGGFALAMAADPTRARAGAVAAVAARSPSPAKQRRSIDCSPADLAVVKGRCAGRGPPGARPALQGRPASCPPSASVPPRAARRGVRRASSSTTRRQPRRPMKPHSVLTEHLVDEPGEPTRAALDQVLDLFRTRLLA